MKISSDRISMSHRLRFNILNLSGLLFISKRGILDLSLAFYTTGFPGNFCDLFAKMTHLRFFLAYTAHSASYTRKTISLAPLVKVGQGISIQISHRYICICECS
jgi:hypothetical protein